METGALIWILHRDKLTESQTALFKELLDYSVEGCLRHKVSPSYTNISIMNAQNLVLLGETLNRPEVLEEGLKRLRAFTLQTALFGVPYAVLVSASDSASAFLARSSARFAAFCLRCLSSCPW